MTVTDYIDMLIAATPPASPEVVEAAAHILASVGAEQVAA